MAISDRKSKDKKKAIGIGIGAGAVLLAVGIGVALFMRGRNAEEPVMEMGPMIVSATRVNIESTYSANGTIISAGESAATADSSKDGFMVSEIFVQVGDTVKKGDPLFSVDLSDTEAKLETAERKLALLQTTNSISENASVRALNNTRASNVDQHNTSTSDLQYAARNTDKALDAKAQAEEDLKRLQQEEANAKAAYEAELAHYNAVVSDAEGRAHNLAVATSNSQQKTTQIQGEIAQIQAQIETAEADLATLQERYEKLLIEKTMAWDAAQSAPALEGNSTEEAPAAEKTPFDPSTDADLVALASQIEGVKGQIQPLQDQLSAKNTELAAAGAPVSEAQAAVNEYANRPGEVSAELAKKQAAYEAAKAARETAEKLINDGNYADAVDTAFRALQAQGVSAMAAARSGHEAELTAQDSITVQRLNNQEAILEAQEEVDRLRKLLSERNVITSDIDGLVTRVNITAGHSYVGDRAVVVNDMSKLKVTVNIDERYIADIAQDMKVRIRTDATGEEILRGVVSFIAPIPTETATDKDAQSQQNANASQRQQRATYRVDVDITEGSDRLKLGMTAKLEFILEGEENCLAVPTSVILNNGDGTGFVQRVLEDGESTEEIMVELGISDSFYTQVKEDGALQEGDMLMGYSMGGMEDVSGDMLNGIE